MTNKPRNEQGSKPEPKLPKSSPTEDPIGFLHETLWEDELDRAGTVASAAVLVGLAWLFW